MSVSAISNSSSPERKCLGGSLLKEIDSPRDDSKDETAYKTLGEQKLSLDSIYPFSSKEKKITNINTINNNNNLNINNYYI